MDLRQRLPPGTGRCFFTVGRALGTVVVTVRGLLDLSSGPRLDRLLADLIDGQGNVVVTVDLVDATVQGLDGIQPMVAAARRSRRRGTRLILKAPPLNLRRELEADGLAEAVEIQTPTSFSSALGQRPTYGGRGPRGLGNPGTDGHYQA